MEGLAPQAIHACRPRQYAPFESRNAFRNLCFEPRWRRQQDRGGSIHRRGLSGYVGSRCAFQVLWHDPLNDLKVHIRRAAPGRLVHILAGTRVEGLQTLCASCSLAQMLRWFGLIFRVHVRGACDLKCPSWFHHSGHLLLGASGVLLEWFLGMWSLDCLHAVSLFRVYAGRIFFLLPRRITSFLGNASKPFR